MTTKEQERNELSSYIESMKKGSYEQMWLITMYSLSSYFKSLFRFGSNSDVTRDNLNVIKEMFNILKTERGMLNYILRNLDSFDIEATEAVIQMLDDLNDKTVEYYYEVIEEIEDAVDMDEERRGLRPRKNFSTLTQSDSYANEVKALALSKKDIREFLGYEQEFWDYIKDMDKTDIRVGLEGAISMSYASYFQDKNGIVTDVKLFVPEIVDLPTALLAIQTYQRAYKIYKAIGHPVESIGLTVNKSVKFEDSYLSSKSFKEFKKVSN